MAPPDGDDLRAVRGPMADQRPVDVLGMDGRELSGTTVTGALPALTTPLANGKAIGDYIASWAAFGGAEAVATTEPRTAHG